MDKHAVLKRTATAAGLLILAVPLAKLLFIVFNITTVSILHNAFNEVRDYVNFRLAYQIASGVNPYSPDILEGTNAPLMFFYTALMPLAAAALCRVTGLSIVAGYYIINLVLILLTAFNIMLIVKDSFKDHKITGALIVLINTSTFFAMFGLPVFNLHTDTVGIYLMSVIILIVYRKKEQTLLLAVLTVFLIFTKQILLVMALPLFVYYLFEDRKLAWRYLWQCAAAGIVTVAAVQILFPLYWTETIYAQFCVNGDTGYFRSALWNIYQFYRRYCMYLLFIAAGLVYLAVKRKSRGRMSVMSLIRNNGFIFYLMLNVLFGTLFLLYLAMGDADGWKYCQDILGTSFFLLALMVWGKCAAALSSKSMISCLMVPALCVMTFVTCLSFGIKYYSRGSVVNMTELDSVIDAHSGEKMYLGMAANSYLLNRDIWEADDIWVNDGQIEYFYLGDYPDNAFLDRIFYRNEIEQAAVSYVDEVNRMTADKEFGLIATCCDRIIDTDTLASNYHITGEYLIMTDTNGYVTVTVWLPDP